MPKSLFNDFQRLMQPPEDDTLVFGGLARLIPCPVRRWYRKRQW